MSEGAPMRAVPGQRRRQVGKRRSSLAYTGEGRLHQASEVVLLPPARFRVLLMGELRTPCTWSTDDCWTSQTQSSD